VPNVLTFGGAALAAAYHAWAGGSGGALQSLGGWATGLALFFPFFLLRGLGAGDVKLLAAVGAWLGPFGALRTGLYSVLAGGVLAIVVAARRRYLKQAMHNIVAMLGFWRTAGLKPVPGVTIDDAAGPRLPYATAIAVGTLAAIWLASHGGGLL
jgi:prepilin peptidase CpaA